MTLQVGKQTRVVPPHAAWVPCICCDEFWCRIHHDHASSCGCPPVEEWGDVDPYSKGWDPDYWTSTADWSTKAKP